MIIKFNKFENNINIKRDYTTNSYKFTVFLSCNVKRLYCLLTGKADKTILSRYCFLFFTLTNFIFSDETSKK